MTLNECAFGSLIFSEPMSQSMDFSENWLSVHRLLENFPELTSKSTVEGWLCESDSAADGGPHSGLLWGLHSPLCPQPGSRQP